MTAADNAYVSFIILIVVNLSRVNCA